MLFGTYDFKCTLLDPAILPAFKGSTFRGAFGGALKRVVCAVRERECSRCLLAGRCLYARVFEIVRGAGDGQNRIAAPPHPYVIEPPLATETRFRAGEGFDFSLLLFGAVNESLPYFIYAFETMGEAGIGSRVAGKRAGFRLERVQCGGTTVYDGATRTLVMPHSLKKLAVPAVNAAEASGAVCVRLLTPLRLKSGNAFTAELPFHVLVRAMLRRISSLFAAYGDGEPPLDYRGLVAAAQGVEAVESSLRWHDWERWSGRQEQTMLMGGLLGTITYEGEIGPFLPLLELSRQLHLGKQTAFGLGKIDF
ncbi:MAG: CRISPR system precrRNA processing endoribonuclease RAMP protein Cas6 [Geobacteraceae bacterium]|nr:CRISPR system precrRNA processing endoribonuclease RAMP protein Cas6 [Geobacteraceae bacterium]